MKNSNLIKTALRTCLFLFFFIAATSYAASQWGTNYKDALAQAAKEHKKILLDFTGSDWCSWCQRLEKETFSQPEFKEYANKNLILVTVDYPQNKEQSAAVKKQNQELQVKYQVEGFPTLILLDDKGEIVKRSTGYLKGGPQGFIDWANN